jgi:hypothetical protein
MTDSILDSVKKVLNLAPDYTAFDQDVIMHINSAFSDLQLLGVGPEQGFMITGNTELWSAFLGGDLRLNLVKSLVFLKVRMLFDPPTLGYLITAMQEQIREYEWKISVQRESVAWVDPNPDPNEQVLDGGRP